MSDAKLFKKRSPFNEDPKLKGEGMIGKAAQIQVEGHVPHDATDQASKDQPDGNLQDSSEHSVRPANGPIVTVGL